MDYPNWFDYVIKNNPIWSRLKRIKQLLPVYTAEVLNDAYPASKGVKTMAYSLIDSSVSTRELSGQNITIVRDFPRLVDLASEHGPYVRLAGICGATALILGAYGAHKSYPKPRAKELRIIFEDANRVHFIHTIALMGVPLSKDPKLNGSLIVLGILLYSGTRYYHAFTGENKFGRLAPVGGIILIFAWLSLVF